MLIRTGRKAGMELGNPDDVLKSFDKAVKQGSKVCSKCSFQEFNKLD